MDAYLTRSFDREAKRHGVSDEDCREAIRKAELGLIDAELGGGLIKQRIPKGNRGASKGSRAIVFYKRGTVAVFLHIFPKNLKASLSAHELNVYREAARELEKLTEIQLFAARDRKGWRQIRI